MNLDERNKKIELYGNGFDMLVEVLKDVPREIWQFKPTLTEWSVHEIIVHLADSETNAALRARKLIVEPGGTVMGYDQDQWANALITTSTTLKMRSKLCGWRARPPTNY